MELCNYNRVQNYFFGLKVQPADKFEAGANISTDVILVPTPSPTDPNDPLRWNKSKKHVAFASVCAFTFLTNYAIGGLAPAFYILSIEFDKSMAETSHLLLWPILVLGAFNFFWVPLANCLYSCRAVST
jgi:hypothetical protein